VYKGAQCHQTGADGRQDAHQIRVSALPSSRNIGEKNLTLVLFRTLTHPPTTGVTGFFFLPAPWYGSPTKVTCQLPVSIRQRHATYESANTEDQEAPGSATEAGRTGLKQRQRQATVEASSTHTAPGGSGDPLRSHSARRQWRPPPLIQRQAAVGTSSAHTAPGGSGDLLRSYNTTRVFFVWNGVSANSRGLMAWKRAVGLPASGLRFGPCE
jgi:hypothetical protein